MPEINNKVLIKKDDGITKLNTTTSDNRRLYAQQTVDAGNKKSTVLRKVSNIKSFTQSIKSSTQYILKATQLILTHAHTHSYHTTPIRRVTF